jgi:hypothetical protein
MGKSGCLLFVLLTVSLSTVLAQSDLSSPASTFLGSLDAGQKEKAVFPYENDERYNWHFVPRSRRGIAFQDMNARQKEMAVALLKATLSDQGFRKASGVLSLEAILREVEGRSEGDGYRDPQKYYLTIFGTPSTGSLWGWRIEGHHISLNVTSEKGQVVASTPSFFGANPAVVPRGADRGKQVLKDETEFGFALVNSLSEEQLKKARFSDRAPADIESGNQRKAERLSPAGIRYTDLNEKQQKAFMKLLDVFVLNYELGFSSKLMTKIKTAGIDNLVFAWAGALQPGEGHYYRIQGPILLIEYDNTQNNANHVHTVVRDLTNDFAEDILREHYEKDHK